MIWQGAYGYRAVDNDRKYALATKLACFLTTIFVQQWKKGITTWKQCGTPCIFLMQTLGWWWIPRLSSTLYWQLFFISTFTYVRCSRRSLCAAARLPTDPSFSKTFRQHSGQSTIQKTLSKYISKLFRKQVYSCA